jgi:hypothetical protein
MMRVGSYGLLIRLASPDTVAACEIVIAKIIEDLCRGGRNLNGPSIVTFGVLKALFGVENNTHQIQRV